MKNYIIEKLEDYSKSNDKIKALFYIKEDNNDEHFSEIYLLMKEIIISKMKEDLEKIFDDYALINKKKDHFKLDKGEQQFTKFEIYTMDSTKITVNIIHYDLKEDFVKNLKGDLNFVYDEEEIESDLEREENIYKMPKAYEFEECSKNFFSLSLDTSFSLLSRDKISAGFKMEALRDELYKLLNWYIIDKYNGGMNIGNYGDNLIHTLEADLRDEIVEIFSNSEIIDTYTAIFKACQIFRKIGMEFAKKNNFTYPKRDDVYSLKLLRKNYKKMESLLV